MFGFDRYRHGNQYDSPHCLETFAIAQRLSTYIKERINIGLDINQRYINRQPAKPFLFYATELNQWACEANPAPEPDPGMVDVLLECGANPNISWRGLTAWQGALMDLCDYILESWFLIAIPHVEILCLLLGNHADVNCEVLFPIMTSGTPSVLSAQASQLLRHDWTFLPSTRNSTIGTPLCVLRACEERVLQKARELRAARAEVMERIRRLGASQSDWWELPLGQNRSKDLISLCDALVKQLKLLIERLVKKGGSEVIDRQDQVSCTDDYDGLIVNVTFVH
jgi:hypothetical protein